MTTKAFGIKISTNGDKDIIDLTPRVAESVTQSEIRDGVVLVFVPGSTAAITTIEYEPGLLQDLPEFFEETIPAGKAYHHDQTWGDANGFSHLRAALQGPSLTIPFDDGKLLLGTWQQVVLAEFDNRPREREIIIQITGE